MTLTHDECQAKIASYIANAPDRKQTSTLDGPYVAILSRLHGSSDIELDPTTGAVLWGTTRSERAPLDQSNPQIRALVDKVKSKCK